MINPSDEYKTTDRPWFAWIFGIAFFLIGIFIMTNGGSAILFGAIFAGAGLLVIWVFGSIMTFSASRVTGMITLTTRSIFGSKVKAYPISQVRSVDVETSYSNNNSRTFRVALILDNGEKLPLRSYYSSGLRSKEKQAERIREFLNLEAPRTGPMGLDLSQIHTIDQQGDTAGIHWKVEKLNTNNSSILTTWFTDSVTFPGQYLILMQNGGPSFMGNALSGLAGSLAKMAYSQIFTLFQLNPTEMDGLKNAQVVDNLDPQLKQGFTALSTFPAAIPEILNPWAIIPLARWAQAHPLKNMQLIRPGDFGQLFVLFSPGGLRLGFVSTLTDEMINQAVDLGIELARAQEIPQAKS